MAEQLAAAKRMGASGLKLFKQFGLGYRNPDGSLIGKIRVPEVVANVCFGGPKRNRLFICGTTSLYAIYLKTSGAGWPA